jgi:creatinine amidohydrolase
MDEVRLDRLTAQAVGEGDYDKAILPLGATEFHGPHLPYGSDTIAADVLAGAFARALGRTLVLPPLQFGVSHHHLAFAWTISLRPETLSSVIRDVGDSLLRHGVRKLLLVSAHDGNAPVANVAARQLSQDHGLSVAIFAGWQRKARGALAGRSVIDLDHAGQSETSLVLYAAPQVVRLELASSQRNEQTDHPVDLVGSYADIAPLGYSGNAAAATRAEGEAIVASLVGLVVPHLRLLDAHGWKGGPWLSGID